MGGVAPVGRSAALADVLEQVFLPEGRHFIVASEPLGAGSLRKSAIENVQRRVVRRRMGGVRRVAQEVLQLHAHAVAVIITTDLRRGTTP